jgi:membrane associated rhomboid family serine protease
VYGRGYQRGGVGFGPPITPPIIKYLLIANGAIFLLQMMFQSHLVQVGPHLVVPAVDAYFAVWPALVWQCGYFWKPFTYMWLHGGLGHLAMNLFVLWMFGSQLALVWGAKRFLRFYLLCGVGAGLIIATFPYLLMGLGILSSVVIPTVGASGAVYGVLLAYSLTWPDRTIMLIFPPVAFRAIWLIPALFFMTYAFGGGNVSHIGHLGGVLVAWFYLRRSGTTGPLLSLGQVKHRWRRYRMRQKLRAIRYEEHNARRRYDDERHLH